MAEKGDKNDRKIACFWDDFDNVFFTPPRHVGSERLSKLERGLKRVPSVALLSKDTAETAKARVQTSARPRATGRPATPAADNLTRGSPPDSARGVFFAEGGGP